MDAARSAGFGKVNLIPPIGSIQGPDLVIVCNSAGFRLMKARVTLAESFRITVRLGLKLQSIRRNPEFVSWEKSGGKK